MRKKFLVTFLLAMSIIAASAQTEKKNIVKLFPVRSVFWKDYFGL